MIEKFSYSLFTIRSFFEETALKDKAWVKFICTSSSEIRKDSLFIPIRGNRDGHDFIPEALAKNASAFLCEFNHPILKSLTKSQIQKAIFVKNTLFALGKLANFHRSRFNPIIIGITGSSGKTTTKELLGIVSLQIGRNNVVVTEKNYNNEIGVPFTLFRINENTKIVICEMGMNHKGEISRLTAMAKPTISMITNIGPCHIENLGSLEKIALAKSEIMEGMSAGSFLYIPENILYKNIFQDIAKKKKINLKMFSLKKNSNIRVNKIIPSGFELNVIGKSINWKVPGEKILENLAGIIAVSKKIGIEPEMIQKGISDFEAKDKRLEVNKGRYYIINDTYNANPDSMVSSLLALKQISQGKHFYAILGDMKELGKFSKKYHLELGNFCQKIGLNGLITFGQNSKYIFKTFSTIDKSLNQNHFADSVDSIEKIIEKVNLEIPSGSYILIKGSRSMKMERIVEGLIIEKRK